MLTVEPIGETARDREAYESVLARSPEGTFFHSLAHRDLLAHTVLPAAEPHYFLARDGSEPLGILPAFLTEGPAGPVLNALPFFGSHGDACVVPGADRTAVRGALLGAFYELASARRCLASTIVGCPLAPDAADDDEGWPVTYRDARIAQMRRLDGAPSPEALWDSLEGRARTAVRKARRAGVRLAPLESEAQLRAFYGLYADHLDALRVPVKPLGFFEYVLHKMVPLGEAEYVLALDGTGEVAAGMLLFHYRDPVEYHTVCLRLERRPDQPLSLLVYEKMEEARRRGRRWWNFGGTPASAPGVYMFKQSWGTSDVPYAYRTVVHGDLAPAIALGRAGLLAAYPWFYVVPFDRARMPAP